MADHHLRSTTTAYSIDNDTETSTSMDYGAAAANIISHNGLDSTTKPEESSDHPHQPHDHGFQSQHPRRHHRRINPLPAVVQAQISSSVQITSLTDVVLELVKNSIDARARNIEVRIEFKKGYCCVIDDGVGIAREEFLDSGDVNKEGGGLGRMYCTSKVKGLGLGPDLGRSWDGMGGKGELDLESGLYYGRFGRFLALVSGVGLLTITSLTVGSEFGENKLVIRDGKRIAVNLDMIGNEELESRISGTKVVVHDLFGRMPVRVKHRSARLENRHELEKDFGDIRKALVGLLLASPFPFSVDVREVSSGYRFVHKESRTVLESGHFLDLGTERIGAILAEAGFLETNFGPWEIVSGRTEEVQIRAAFSLQPVPTREVQFISIGIRPVHNQVLLDEINSIFDASSFGTDDDLDLSVEERTSEADNPRGRRPVATAKAVDRWPVFYIRIELSGREAATIELDNSSREVDKYMQRISHVLRSTILEFLESNGIRTGKYSRMKKRTQSRQLEERRDRSVSVDHQHSVTYGFDTWSRMKSSRSSLKQDIRSGLPFSTKSITSGIANHVSRDDPLTSRPALSVPSAGSSPGVDGLIKWADPCTKRTLLLNARTGMVVSGHNHDLDRIDDRLVQEGNESQSFMRRSNIRFRDIKETAKQLASHSLGPTHGDIPIPSASLDIRSRPSFNDIELSHNCSDDGCATLRVASPTNNEAVLDSRITKEGLRMANIIGQVDEKFILVSMSHQEGRGSASETTLVLIDQHAADERVRVEELYRQICQDVLVKLATPLVFEVNPAEAELFQRYRDYFSSWKICLDICGKREGRKVTIHVVSLPQLIAERCRMEPRLVIELLRAEIWRRHGERRSIPVSGPDWLSKITDCPQGVLDMLNSRACRSAVMFNDKLTTEQCRGLVRQLGKCFFPFQCAHGRPSMTVLVKLKESDEADRQMNRVAPTFGQSWTSWME